ncbi:YfiT family bacillithiol transferase [Mucilaginibacter sp.]|uniref:YfiT family bacillithiol transferase n=1 Tax=Mucilaginibacter sp. TaxID=1882438 RepID=UPI00261E88ED|nr:putative metal-dependent hydrolase [Mucilaginibacter sp.]MDB4926102.1 putative metal-dependent hydrolase [Mucilaginibacter sp.]
MSTTPNEQLKYPIGKFVPPASYTNEDIRGWINDIKELPGKLRQVIITLNETQLDTPYRPGGWTLKQVVHHMADSHMNSLIRFKWALTEDKPVIKAYEQTDWAMLADYRLPVEPSLKMLEGIHQHLVALFESFSEEQWDKYFVHPETGANVTLKRNLGIYAWHGKHHLAHITETIKRF